MTVTSARPRRLTRVLDIRIRGYDDCLWGNALRFSTRDFFLLPPHASAFPAFAAIFSIRFASTAQ